MFETKVLLKIYKLHKIGNNKMPLQAQEGNTLMHFQNPDRQQNVVTCSKFYAERSVQIVSIFPKLYSCQNWILHKLTSFQKL